MNIRILMLLACLIVAPLSRANVVVLTSFPESFYSQVESAYRKYYPKSKIRFLNKKTPALIAHLMQNRQPLPNLVWVSSSDAMALMQQLGHIEQPVTFAWSEFGLFWHQKALERYSLPLPTGWDSLLEPQFAGKVALSAPSRSGTNHLVIELILQQYGWQKGWQLITQLSGNLATITARSFGVRQGIVKQRFVVAPVVDFFYKNALAEGYEVGFTPLSGTPLIPAQIAHVSAARSEEAQGFIDFIMSEQGQQLLSSPKLNRISLKQGVEITKQKSSSPFDQQLSAARYHIVNRLFDVFISERLTELQHFWRLWHQLEASNLTSEQQQMLERLFHQVTQVPIDESVAVDPALNVELSPLSRYDSFSQRISQSWQTELEATLINATIELEVLSQAVTGERDEEAP